MFELGQKVIYKKTNEESIIEEVNTDSTGEWYFISVNGGDCISVDADEKQPI